MTTLQHRDLANAIRMSNGLMNRLEGIRDAAVRQHAAQGGSYGALASSMGVTRATRSPAATLC